MGQLKVLPSQIANMIAAGEVVQRPASVVKELMENAVDAGADRISVIVTDSGRTSVQVVDNGCGMSPSDAVLCFDRHATSKIASAEDLEAILTYGFRGEALASIAAVAEVTLKTRRAGDDTATQVVTSDCGNFRTSTVSAPIGTSFTVRNIFYNTPARRKFLKSDAVELKHIIEEFTRIAIPHPEIAFSLSSNGRDIYSLGPAKSLKFRILDILGTNVVGDVVDISAVTSAAKISGFVGRPDAARKTQFNQYFFVGGRFFKSAYLHKAVMKAYEDMIPGGCSPAYFIFLVVDPHSVDVNIHPTKTEIKFEDDSLLFQLLYACVKETLGHNYFGASIDFDTEGAVPMPQLGRSFDEYKPTIAPAVDFDTDYNPFDPDSKGSESREATPSWQGKPSGYVDHHEDYGVLFQQRSADVSRAMIVGGKYILTPSASGMMAVNIRRAWERILYERTLEALGKGEHVTQQALFPVQVQVGVQQRMLFDDNADMLRSLGFDITPIGSDTVAVAGVPEGYSCEPGKIVTMVSDLVLVLSDRTSALSEVVNQRMAEKLATLGAINSTAPANSSEAQKLIDTLFACSSPELTSSGKRITAIISLDDIDKKF